MKKVKFLPVLIVFDILAIISFVISSATFGGALAVIKAQGSAGKVVAFMFILVVFLFCLSGSCLFSIVGLPFAVISTVKSEKKVFPIISLVIYSLFIILTIVFIVILVMNGKPVPTTN